MEHKSLGLRLLELRQSHGLTQKQLCESLNLGRSTYSYFETGSRVPDLDTLLLIARYYHVSLDDLVSPPGSVHNCTAKEPGGDCSDILLAHHLKSKHIPIDFVLELSKADFDFLKDYRNLTDDNKAELQFLIKYKLRKQKNSSRL